MPADRPSAPPGGRRELLALAVPLVLSNSFLTVQITLDRWMLSKHETIEVGAAFQAAMLFWLPFGLAQGVASYVTTFVAQYTGADRPHRVGPAVWQGLHLSLLAGILFLALWPLAPSYVAVGQHEPAMQALEVEYLRILGFAALPMLVSATVGGFFSGRGSPWAVLGINAAGTVVNGVLDYLLIFGKFGLPELGIAGAAWATAAGAWASAAVALALFWQPQFRRAFDTLSGWLPERELFGRLIWYGGPAGLQVAVDVLTFTLFTLLVGWLGSTAASAIGIAITFNLFTFLPMYGVGQAVAVLVGQRLGEDRPDLAERTTNLGVRWAMGYQAIVAFVFIAFPGPLVELFRPDIESAADPVAAAADWAAVSAGIPKLLALMAVYALADGVNIVYACALRGAGDTRFVTWLTFGLAWPLMVIPTYVTVTRGGSVFLAWGFASLFIFVVAVCFWLRFRSGVWKSMRVIEPSVVGESPADETSEVPDAREPIAK